MRSSLLSAAGLAAGLTFGLMASPLPAAAQSGSARPQIIPGIGPSDLPARTQPDTQVAEVPRGSYGGGFIELLMTGRDPTPPAPTRGVIYNVPEPSPRPMRATRQMIEPEPEPMRAQGRRTAALSSPDLEPAPLASRVAARFQRQEVAFDGRHSPGTIVIDASDKFLYLVQPGGKALRYGIGVGRPGFGWSGNKSVTMKREWPDWRPPAQMLKRRPDLPRHMKGGPDNPLGARALYLGSSLYRIHGTNEPHTIGQAVSSGCFRMTNADVIDLYNRVRVGAKVVVR